MKYLKLDPLKANLSQVVHAVLDHDLVTLSCASPQTRVSVPIMHLPPVSDFSDEKGSFASFHGDNTLV